MWKCKIWRVVWVASAEELSLRWLGELKSEEEVKALWVSLGPVFVPASYGDPPFIGACRFPICPGRWDCDDVAGLDPKTQNYLSPIETIRPKSKTYHAPVTKKDGVYKTPA